LWHNTHIHDFHLNTFDPEQGTANLEFDLDYILKWDQDSPKNKLLFTVCRAELIFHHVPGLKFLLDYTAFTAGMSPFSISGIEREPLTFPTGYTSFRWFIPINWPSGEIQFEAPSFTLRLVGKPVVQSGQFLSEKQRRYTKKTNKCE